MSKIAKSGKSRFKTGKVSERRTKPRKARPDGARRSPEMKLAELKRLLLEIYDLNAAGSVLSWDEATYMPTGGATARGRQTATLRRLAHERFVDPALGRLVDDLGPYAEGLPPDDDDASLIRVVRRDFEKAIKVPADYVARANAHGSASYNAWTRARPANDFAAMVPHLEKTLDLSREYAGFFAPYNHIADPMIDDADEGMTTALIRKLFVELRRELVPMVRAIADQPVTDDGCLRARFPEAAQLDFGLSVAKRFGYDLARGRLDKTHHPFCTKFAAAMFASPPGCARTTSATRCSRRCMKPATHSTSRALTPRSKARRSATAPRPAYTRASRGCGRMLSARSRGFWTHCYPALQDVFRSQLGGVTLDTFYRAINKVERSLIRTDADEVTYNLHIMLRFDLELKLLEGRLRVKDLPEAWRAAHAIRPRRHTARRPRRLPAGRALVRRQPRRRLPELHHRQHSQRPVFRSRHPGAARHSASD